MVVCSNHGRDGRFVRTTRFMLFLCQECLRPFQDSSKTPGSWSIRQVPFLRLSMFEQALIHLRELSSVQAAGAPTNQSSAALLTTGSFCTPVGRPWRGVLLPLLSSASTVIHWSRKLHRSTARDGSVRRCLLLSSAYDTLTAPTTLQTKYTTL